MTQRQDITYLPTPIKRRFLYLYLFLDVFSRKIVGWQVYETESSEQAADVLRDLCRRENIPPDQLVLHADNGAPMKGATLLATLQELGVVPSYSRPAVSNDNPYSEALLKIFIYRPEYPVQSFPNFNDARDWISHTRKRNRVNHVYLNPEKAKTVAESLPLEEAA